VVITRTEVANKLLAASDLIAESLLVLRENLPRTSEEPLSAENAFTLGLLVQLSGSMLKVLAHLQKVTSMIEEIDRELEAPK
jgi:hypothetical protein